MEISRCATAGCKNYALLRCSFCEDHIPVYPTCRESACNNIAISEDGYCKDHLSRCEINGCNNYAINCFLCQEHFPFNDTVEEELKDKLQKPAFKPSQYVFGDGPYTPDSNLMGLGTNHRSNPFSMNPSTDHRPHAFGGYSVSSEDSGSRPPNISRDDLRSGHLAISSPKSYGFEFGSALTKSQNGPKNSLLTASGSLYSRYPKDTKITPSSMSVKPPICTITSINSDEE